MSTSTTFPFTTSGNYTFDSSIVEVTGGEGKLKNNQPADSIAVATYTSSLDFNYGDGVTTSTIVSGAPAVSGGYLVMTAGSDQLSYSAVGNLGTTIGAVRFLLQPQYSGSPGTTQVFLDCNNGANNANQLQIYQLGGNLFFKIWNSAGAAVVSITTAWSPTSGQDYEFEFNWDGTAGSSRAWIDGTEFGTEDTTTFVRANTNMLIKVGSTAGAQTWKAEYFTFFDAVQHTGDYTAPIAAPSEAPYDLTNPTLLTNTTFNGVMETFAEVTTVAGSDLIKYVLQVSGTDKYYTGTAWATSTGYAQSNLASEWDAATLNELDADRDDIKLKVYLHSETGLTTPSIDSATITYTAALSNPSEPTRTAVQGFVYDNNGPVSGAVIQVRPYLQGFQNSGVFNVYDWRTLSTSSSNGHFSGVVFNSPSSHKWEFKIISRTYSATISGASVDFSALGDLELVEV